MTAFGAEQVLDIAVPSFRRVVVPANPFGIENALVGDPVDDAILWIIVSEDNERVYPWYAVTPLFHPDSDGLAIEVGSLAARPPSLAIGRSEHWLRRDPEARDRLSGLLALETTIVRDRFGAAAAWAEHVIPDESDYDDFPELLETKAYASLLAGQDADALALLGQLSLLHDTIGRRSAEMHDQIVRDRTGALGILASWRERRLAMFGLGAMAHLP